MEVVAGRISASLAIGRRSIEVRVFRRTAMD